jgi:hypothetical protein
VKIFKEGAGIFVKNFAEASMWSEFQSKFSGFKRTDSSIFAKLEFYVV